MNVSKIALPPTFLVNFYYYFSYLSLTVTILITPLLFYVIVTQSKDLKGFKWFILNHSFWLLTVEALICLIKPIILGPALGGYPLSVIREDGSYAKSGLAVILIGGCILNFAVGLAATIATRYLLIFPSAIMKYLNLKVATGIASGLNLAAYIALFFLAITNFPENMDEIRKQEIKYDNFFVDFVDPSVIFFPYENVQTVVAVAFGVIILLIILAISVVCIFINLVLSSATVTSTKMQRPLIVSSIIQISFTCIFLILPILIIVGIVAFQIPNTAGLCTFCICIICSYSVIDFAGTLYFVAPYRRFVKRQIFTILRLQQPTEVHVITKIPTEARSVRVHVIVSVITN